MNFVEAYEKMKDGWIVKAQGFGEVFIRKTVLYDLMCMSPGDQPCLSDRIPDAAIKDMIEKEFALVEKTEDRIKKVIK